VEPPYIEVIYDISRRKDSREIAVTYHRVQIVQADRESLYATGNYANDINQAQIDARLIPNIQRHPSVASYERLIATAPNERHKFLPATDG
jgi:hypothetical protein